MEEDKTLKNIIDDDFGKIILKIRKDKNLTQKELADLINVSDRTISKWENGQSVPDLICIKNICKALGISPSSLVLDKKTKKEHISDIKTKIKDFLKPKHVLLLIISILFILLFIFYLNNRNTVTIYKLKLSSDDIFIRNGYFIKTKYKNMLVIDGIELTRNDGYDSINVQLYTIVNGDKTIIYERNNLDNIYIDQFDAYTDKLKIDLTKSITESMYITITINNNGEECIYDGTFSIIMKYNNALINRALHNDEDEIVEVMKEETINKDLIEKGFIYNSETDTFEKTYNDYTIIIYYLNNLMELVKLEDNIFVLFKYNSDSIEYKQYKNKKLFIHYKYYIDDKSYSCELGKCKKHYNEIDEILEIYNEIKGIL